jgi:hypothetical protein
MSRPTAISPEEQEQIARRIGVLLLRSATEDWQQITVEYRATGDHHDLLGEVASQNGTSEPWEPPEELVGIFEHLREGMYRPDVGTWLSALYVVERPSSYRIDINFDTEPQWNRPLPTSAYVEELHRYPRSDENIPDWMRARLEASAPQELPVRDAVPRPGPQPPEPATTRSAVTGGAGIRQVQVFDGLDDQGRPTVSARMPLAQEEIGPLRHYLENAPIVLPSHETERDQLDAQSTASVPLNWRTDGTWVWQDAVAYYLAQYGVPPQNEFVEGIRGRGFTLPQVDEATLGSIRRELSGQRETERPGEPPVPAPAPPPPPVPDIPPIPDTPPVTESPSFADAPPIAEPEPEPEAVPAPQTMPASPTMFEPQAASEPAVEHEPQPEPHVESAAAERPEEVAPQPEEVPEEISEPALGDVPSFGEEFGADSPSLAEEEPPAVLSTLRDKLGAYGIAEDGFSLHQHDPGVPSLLREGSEWIVTQGSPESPEVRFAQPEQAAAYLLGSMLLSRSAQSPAAQSPAAQSPASQPSAAQPAPQAKPEPEPEAEPAPAREPEPAAEESNGGHFLFTANQAPAEPAPAAEEQANQLFTEPPRAPAEASQASPEGQPNQFFAEPQANQAPSSDTQNQFFAEPQTSQVSSDQTPPGEESTRFQPMPRLDRPSSPPAGQPTMGQNPQSLPKRPPRLDQGGPSRPAERPAPSERLAGPPQQGAGGPGPVGGAERRPGPAGPPRGPMPGAGPRPPQQPQQAGPPPMPGPGREQQIQPLRGEPPLTLYRDRRPTMLQPGTDLDRFGDPSGNVMYALRTPYSQRSLPPQWSGRPYFAYRVQRPVQALRGTAVPWFEQPGGGTAYVLPASVSDLLADGTLVELSGVDAPPRPPE